jgi:hypothetical protein
MPEKNAELPEILPVTQALKFKIALTCYIYTLILICVNGIFMKRHKTSHLTNTWNQERRCRHSGKMHFGIG